jgi:DNA-binding MarR family transcriptional regulator
MRREANDALKSTGLNVETFMALTEMDGKKAMQSIADSIGVDAPSLSRMSALLIENNFAVENAVKPGCPKFLRATAKGKRIVERNIDNVVEILGGIDAQ